MQNKEKNFVSAVVYVRNEEKKIYDFLDKVNGILKNMRLSVSMMRLLIRVWKRLSGMQKL